MPDHKKRFESMLFNNETSNRIDFNNGDIKPIITTKYLEKPSCSRIRPRPLKDIHALTDWNRPMVPFNLFGKPKDILATNPNDVQKAYGESPDYERKSVQKTRPRLAITPAVCLDDVADGPRKILTDNMYLTSTVFSMREALSQANYNSLRAPFPGRPAPADPLSIPKLSLPYVSPEWRMDSVSWDNRSLRAYAHPTREFWLARKPKKE